MVKQRYQTREKVLVGATKKKFTGSWILLIILLICGFFPGLIYFLVRQGEKRYEYRYGPEKKS